MVHARQWVHFCLHIHKCADRITEGSITRQNGEFCIHVSCVCDTKQLRVRTEPGILKKSMEICKLIFRPEKIKIKVKIKCRINGKTSNVFSKL